MSDVADIARENAIPLEAKKDGLQQRQDGSWLLRLRVHPQDSIDAIAKAPMGQRYMLALVELGDNEEPKARKQWHELPPASQSAIRCGEKAFHQFLKVSTDEEAAEAVRVRCGVKSRSELSTDEKAKDRWDHLDRTYQEWLRQ